MKLASARSPLPVQPVDVPWPTRQWPRAAAPPNLQAAVAALCAASDRFGDTHALLVIQNGRLLHAHYADGRSPDGTLPSWSMAKSITHALAGLLVMDARLDIDLPLRAREWTGTGDDRAAITLRHLLAMRDGLDFVEDYEDEGISDVMAMLWGDGSADVAGYAAAKPLLHAPGVHFNYASGSTNIVARHLGTIVGGGVDGMTRFMTQRLFAPIGIQSANPKFDAAGTFKGSSFCFCTAEDFARFGLLYLRNGIWDGARLLPAGWVDAARTPTFTDHAKAHGHYGMHWWINDGHASFYASGFEGQRILVLPAQDALLVRLGKSNPTQGPLMHAALLRLADLLPASA